MTAAGQPLLRPGHGQLGLGPVLRQGAGRPARRHEPGQPAGPSRAARRPGAALRRAQVRPPRPDPDDRDLGGLRPVVGHGRRATSSDTRLFSHQLPRPLTAHQMADALAQATDVPNRYPRRAAGTAGDRGAPTRRRPARSSTRSAAARGPSAAPSVSTPALSLRQSLLLIGGDVIESKVTSLNGYLASLLEARARARGARREPLPPDRLPAADGRGALALVGRAEAGFVAPRGGRGPLLGAAQLAGIRVQPLIHDRADRAVRPRPESRERESPCLRIRAGSRAAARAAARSSGSGSLGFLGLGLDDWFRLRAVAAGPQAGGASKVKNCILIWLAGGPVAHRHVRPQARRPGRRPGRVQADRHRRSRASRSARSSRTWPRSWTGSP